MSKKNKNKEFKKTVVEDNFVEEEDNKKSIILILIAIVAVLGLIFASIFLFNTEETEKPNDEGERVEVKLPVEETVEEEKEELAIAKKYKVIYTDEDGKQLGKTQEVLDLEDRVNEKAPKVEGKRFVEWLMEEIDEVYYCTPIYVSNVERIPLEEEPYLDEEDGETERTYNVEITEVLMPGDEVEVEDEGVIAITNPTYEVEITGEVEELEPTEIAEELTIDEEYNHIVGLKFNAPEDITKENIDNMTIEVFGTNALLTDGQYHFNGEDPTKTGRDLLDSTDEEYESGIFYFYYYQEADTKTNTTLEVYWGNDPEADANALPDPVLPKDEYVEVYNVNLDNVELETES